MGVKGLWSLLNPVARPVQIESLDGKRLAIDSSIWLYQSTMRDKDGRVLVNAHVLGFLRRINRLLFHGIKPVFVFDGGAPTLKRNTIAERKRKKLGAAQSHAKMAEKLLHAQMRREAVRLAEEADKKRAARIAARAAGEVEEGEEIPENAVYLDELEGTTRTPLPTAASSSTSVTQAPTTAEKKRFYKKDRYELPAADVPAFATEDRPDARLATEDELKQFIEDVAPEDIDVDSPEFRALPTEVQYEIIGDMRVRSRQQSHARLTAMLANAPTALDFSKAQIKHLSQRNALTQQLLTVTDMVGKAHLTIPVRVAAERNREYVLVKRTEDEGGGWALGIREGTKDRPIELEPETENDKRMREKQETARLKREEDEESDYRSDGSVDEEKPDVDKDLREHRRREVLQAITARYAPAPRRRASADEDARQTRAAPGAAPLFDMPEDVVPTANDEALALALQQEELGSDEEKADPELARALAISRLDAKKAAGMPPPASPSEDSDEFEEVTPRVSAAMSRPNTEPVVVDSSDDEDIEVVEVPKTSLRRDELPAGVAGEKAPASMTDTAEAAAAGAAPPRPVSPAGSSSADSVQVVTPEPEVELESSMDESPSPSPPHRAQTLLEPAPPQVQAAAEVQPQEVVAPSRDPAPLPPTPAPIPTPRRSAPSPSPPRRGAPSLSPPRRGAPSPSPPRRGAPSPSPPRRGAPSPSPPPPVDSDSADEDDFEEVSTQGPSGAATPYSDGAATPEDLESTLQDSLPGPSRLRDHAESDWDNEDDDDDEAIEWSRSPTPERSRQLAAEASAATIASAAASDFASDGEMGADDMVAEEDEYARFLAQIQNRDLADVRTEIDDEIRILHGQTKAAMRDSDEITQTMIAQIQTLLRHFGIPYITAPMEAEAQCAKLAELGLVDGIITDDSDVFLFGGTQCFKNIFNDAKFAECFVATDIERELSLTRERLIALAYLLGSDYTLGIMGVGPVMALELLSNFPGPDGLLHFKEWWMRVQQGIDLPVEADTKWKRSFKKRFGGNLHLGADWPNPHVREAYLHPTADASEEPFHWGFPRLAALRVYLHEELSWSISKVDDELTPIVQRIAQRGRGGVQRQGTLLPFFDHGAAVGKSYAPRQRTTANVSKRLLAVIKEFREAEARVQGQQPQGWGEMLAGIDEQDPKGFGRKPSGTKGKGKETNGGDGGDGDGDEGGDESQPKSQPKRKRATRSKGSAAASATASASASAAASDAEDVPPPPKRRRGNGRGNGRGHGRGRGGGRCPAM